MAGARHASLAELAIAAVTLAMLILIPRRLKRIPAPLMALPIAALLAAALGHFFPGHAVATIASRFHATIGGRVVDGVPPLPPLPMLPWHAAGPGGAPFQLSFATLQALLSGALAVAMLGGIESLLSAVIADGMAGTRHDPDAELLALGIANVITPFLGGIPATGAIARTATNIRSGARSPIAADRARRDGAAGRPGAGAADRLPADGRAGGAAAAGRLEHVGGEALRAHPARRAAQRRRWCW